jgi:phytoene dehydrogenase-like protein
MKISIIGAGVSGLSIGCYLQMNGFETEIFEKHSHAGGLCTSWKRGEFTFDGCIHWLMGSNSSSPFYRLWSELVDMKSVEFFNHEVRFEIELEVNRDRHGDRVFHLYNNINRLEAYLLDLAPEDTGLIKDLIRSIRVMQRFELPPMIENAPVMQSWRKRLAMASYLPFVILYLKWRNVTNFSFARKLKNPFLKEAFELLFDGEEFKMLILTMPLSIFDRNGAGYPIGGSYRFANRIAERYKALGGKIHYDQPVKRILTGGNRAQGVLLQNDSIVYSDITISATDWYFTMFEALEGRFLNNSILALASQRTLKLYPSVFLISLGVSRSFSEYPHLIRFPLNAAVASPDGTVYTRIESHIYHYDPTLAPEGKTIIVLSLYTRNGDFWINLRNKDMAEYNRCKTEFAEKIIDRLNEKIEGVKASVEITDVATPATYHRYTGSWKGSVQGWFPDRNLLASSPVGIGLAGLSDFYYSSQWSVPGGGLPVVIKAGRDLSRFISMKYKKQFIIK